MNVSSHHTAQCLVNEPVTLETSQVREAIGYDADPEVSAPVRRARVPDVMVAVVDNLERRWRERSVETVANSRDAIGVQRTTCRNGVISLSARSGPGRLLAYNIVSSRSGYGQQCVP